MRIDLIAFRRHSLAEPGTVAAAELFLPQRPKNCRHRNWTMTRQTLCLLIAASFLLPSCASVPPKTVSLAIENVTVIDPESGNVQRNRSVYIDGDKIDAVARTGRSNRYLADQVIDGTDKYLVPGFVDMHGHVGYNPLIAAYSFNLMIANGVTAVRDPGGDCWEPKSANSGTNAVCIYDLRARSEQIESGELVGPHLLMLSNQAVKGPIMRHELPEGAEPFFFPETEDQGRTVVRYLKDRGVDFIKTYNLIPRDVFFAMADEANNIGIDFAGHVPGALTVVEYAEAGGRSIEHARAILYDCSLYGKTYREEVGLYANRVEGAEFPDDETRLRRTIEEFNADQCAAVLKALKDNDTYYVPTHETREVDARAIDPEYRKDPNTKYIPGPLLDFWMSDLDATASAPQVVQDLRQEFFDHGLKITKLAHDAGVKVMIGTDTPETMVLAGFSYHDEMVHFANAGLEPMDILRAASTVPAEYFGMQDVYGGISKGKIADLILIDADPLADIRNAREISAVISAGRLYDRARLDGMLAEAEAVAQSFQP